MAEGIEIRAAAQAQFDRYRVRYHDKGRYFIKDDHFVDDWNDSMPKNPWIFSWST